MLVGILVTHDRTGRKKKRASRTSAADAQQKLLNDLSGPTEAGRVVTAYERANGSGVPSNLTISIADLLEGVNGLFDDVISEDVANRLGIERSESEFTERLRFQQRDPDQISDRELLDGTGIAVPDNVVPPALLIELKKAGVPIAESGKVRAEADVKYSIRSFADGGQFVHVDTEQKQFEGLTGNELRKRRMSI